MTQLPTAVDGDDAVAQATREFSAETVDALALGIRGGVELGDFYERADLTEGSA